MRVRRRGESGFTLIELMVVVGIVSLLAAVAIPTFSKYIRKAKSTEARTSLKQIIDGATAYYYDEQTATKSIGSIPRKFPGVVTGAAATDDPACCAGGGTLEKCNPPASVWDDEVWQALHFSMEEPHFYRYSYSSGIGGGGGGFGGGGSIGGVASGATDIATAGASGDLNCDGVNSFYLLRAYVIDGKIVRYPLNVEAPLE